MNVDYIIVGQGISGTFLSYYLIRQGKRVIVVDEYKSNTASRVASGIINPVTGRRVVRTWKIEELLPFAQDAYSELSDSLGVCVARDIDILTFHTNSQMVNAWQERIAEGERFLSHLNDLESLNKVFNITLGADVTSPCMLVSMDLLLNKWRQVLKEKEALLEGRFSWNDCTISDGVYYKEYTAQKIIICNGIAGFDNPYFKKLPYAFSKGEAIIVSIPGLPQNNIYKQGFTLVPLGAGKFWLGSSFEWDFDDDRPTADFRDKAENLLKSWLKIPYEILSHTAGIRPGSLERRPFVGTHPVVSEVAMLNGMGTKGCSLAPYFAAQLSENLLHDKNIDKEADINRFRKVLTK